MRIPAKEDLGPLFRREKRLLARFVVTALGRAGASMAAIFLIKDFLTGVLGGAHGVAGLMSARSGEVTALWLVAFLLVVAYVGGSLLSYDNQVAQQRIVKILELGMMERLIRHLLTLSVPFFDRQSHGDIVQAVRQDVTNLRTTVQSIANLFLEGTHALALLVAVVWLSPSLTLWAFAAVPVALLPILAIAKRTLVRSYGVRRTGYALFDITLQILSGIRVIKAYQGEGREAQDALEKGRSYFDQLIDMVRVRSLAQVVFESVAGFGVVVVIVAGGFQVMDGALTWPALLAFLMAVRALHGPLNNMNSAYAQIVSHGASVERIRQLLDARPEVIDRPGALPLATGPGRIAFERVGFAYGETRVLDELSFEIRAGETFGIVGPSGAGKSTLLNLIVRFYDPTSGRVLFDGKDLRDYRLADVYDKMAIVTQSPFLFATTVAENIRVGRPNASDEEVEEAARAAGVHEEILTLPKGYQTVIGVAGRGLSGGQAQRINVARAILKNAPILLLDEATSSLDSLAEVRVQRAIDRLAKGRTTCIVAHRLSTLRHAGRILVLDQGRSIGLGSHEELLDRCPLYRRLWEMQLLTERGPMRVSGSPRGSEGMEPNDVETLPVPGDGAAEEIESSWTAPTPKNL